MPSNRLYYHFKPYLPWGLRMAVRRIVAQRRRQAVKDVWPINETAGQPPEGWPGWPHGKKFALVLTHDVEGPVGLSKCRQLMRLEMELGFRSSFNFVPEGDYAVPRELREELVQNGFEIGVHDLHHDGKLYSTRRDFSENAKWINQYLREWGAVGFRSGFMFHNLEWMHDLNVEYSSCTFDTDPFEPQPDGVNTIFPFWVPCPHSGHRTSNSEIGNRHSGIHPVFQPPSLSPQASKSGYVELPYTLPQDSTLFLVLRERSPEIWFKKLDWLVARGGMALVDVHPDYLAFNGGARKVAEYPSGFYAQFLDYVSTKFSGMYWHALPREVADYFTNMQLANELHRA